MTAYDADTRAAIALLESSPHCTGKIGAMGICVGGHLAFRAAMNASVLATACFYATDIHKGSLGSGGDDSLARAGEIRGELMMIWGRQDPHVPPEGRAKSTRASAKRARASSGTRSTASTRSCATKDRATIRRSRLAATGWWWISSRASSAREICPRRRRPGARRGTERRAHQRRGESSRRGVGTPP